MALPVGYMLEEYRLGSVLGQGGFGITYLAHDTKLDVRVAIKEMLPKDFATRVGGVNVAPQDPTYQAGFEWAKNRFIDEARLLARLQHSNIVRVFRFLERNGTAYMVMEFVEGRNFSSWLKVNRQPAEKDLREILLPLLDGLEHVHGRNLLHRDISPENIFITDRGKPLLLDFGSAREVLQSGGQKLSGVIRPGFSPVEQYQSTATQGPFTDIYAMAGVFIFAITRALPPVSVDRAGTADRYVPLASRYQGQYSEAFLHAIDTGFKLWATDRPQSVEEWRKLLAEPIEEKKSKPKRAGRKSGKSAPDVPQEGSGKSPKVRSWAGPPAFTALIGLLVAVALGLGAWAYFGDDGHSGGTLDPDPSPKPGPKKVDPGKTETIVPPSGQQSQVERSKRMTNSIGMEFVVAEGVNPWICVHATRRRDYAVFARSAGANSAVTREWEQPRWNDFNVGTGENDPVVKVDWYEAAAFCAWLSHKEDQHYRLPTNAEWEQIAGRQTFPWGETWPPRSKEGKPLANLADLSAVQRFGRQLQNSLAPYNDGFATVSPVKSFPPNAAGIYDLGGNVREWCEDSSPSGNGQIRGASWLDGSREVLSSHTAEEWGKEIRSPMVGFRCVVERE